VLSKAVFPIGVAVAGVLSVLVLLGVALEHWALAAASGCVLVSACLLVSLDTWRRVRALHGAVRNEIASLAACQGSAGRSTSAGVVDSAGTVTPADVVGAVRLLQAQYVGRLDRLQISVEALVEHAVPRDEVGTDAASAAAQPPPAEPAPDPTR